MEITWFGTAGFRIKTDRRTLLIDPYVSRNDRAFPNIWLHDFAQSTDRPVTSDLTGEVNPVWSVDGNRIIFGSDPDGPDDIYQVPVRGIRKAELLLESDLTKRPSSCSSNGQYLLYTVEDPETREDLWIYTMDKSGSETPFIATQYNEKDGRFSPDMQYVAYVSDKSGIDEVYVCEFSSDFLDTLPEIRDSRSVSRGPGIEPRWRGDSRELYYSASDGKVMVVEITAGETFQASTPRPLFPTPTYIPVLGTSAYPWDVTSDGKRFLLPVPVAETSPSPFDIILNWTNLLEQ